MDNRQYFFCGVALLTMALTAGCSRDNEVYQPSKAEIMANAEQRLGVTIDPEQDWNMTSQGRACITVNGNDGETYTVKIYSNDPLVEKKGYILKKGTVKSGSQFITEFDYPTALTWIVVGMTDSHGFTNYRSVRLNEGLLIATFGSETAETRSLRKSRSNAEVPQMANIPTSAYAKSFLEGAEEPNDQNTNDNYKEWIEGEPEHYEMGKVNIDFNAISAADKTWFETYVQPFIWWQFDIYGTSDREAAWEVLVGWVKNAGHTDWLTLVPASDGYWKTGANYTDHFKITGTYDKIITVLPSEGDLARTVYVSGKWTIPANQQQSVGGGAVIVVDAGGEIVIPEGSTLTFINQARLIVMPEGKISGQGTLLVTNGNAAGKESYNGGDINVGKFNNNFGKFYNYGKLRATAYAAGAGESNIYNHGLVHIGGAGNRYYSEAANARIYNACQWYCDTDMRAYIVENTQGSYFYVAGELITSDGTDGTGVTSYVALANGALMRIGSIYNNNCDWIGPTKGYAVVEAGKVSYLNWTGDGPIERGFFQNNIAITIDDKTNNCEGKSNENAYQVLSRYVANGIGNNGNTKAVGNGGVSFVEKFGASVIIPRDNNFVAGESGCTPGYEGVGGGVVENEPSVTPDPDPETPTESNVEEDVPAVWTYAFEDTPLGDYDMNDVVIKVSENLQNENLLDVTLCCAGAAFDLHVNLGNYSIFGGIEVHRVLGQPSGTLINTGAGPEVNELVPTQIEKPSNFSFATADFWIESPAFTGGVHIAKKGEDPHGVAIPGDWKWPNEAVNIKEAYPNFIRFAADVEGADEEASQWYKTTSGNPVEGKVYVQQ